MVSKAFLPFFVKTVGHFGPYVKRSASDQPGVFQARPFYKAIPSKTTRHFVKKFIRSQMFDLFIQEVEQQPATQEGPRAKSHCACSSHPCALASPFLGHRPCRFNLCFKQFRFQLKGAVACIDKMSGLAGLSGLV